MNARSAGAALKAWHAKERPSPSACSANARKRTRPNSRPHCPKAQPASCSADLNRDDDIAALHQRAQQELGQIDFLIHAAAFSPQDGLTDHFLDVTRPSFASALESSVYSFVAVAKDAQPLLSEGGSIITLTYLGSARVVPHYNTMGVAKAALEASVRYMAADLGPQGVRVNAISAGPTMTLAARGIPGFTEMYKASAGVAPLRRNTGIGDVGDTAAFLVSDWARGITGEVLYVDNGLHILG